MRILQPAYHHYQILCFVPCALCFLLCDMQWYSQVIDNARAQHRHTMLLRTAVQSTEATSGVGGACPSVPYLDHAIGDMPCILMLCICSPQHQSLKKPSVPRPLEQLPQLQLSRSAATHNPPYVIERSPYLKLSQPAAA